MAARRLSPLTIQLLALCAAVAAWTSAGALTIEAAGRPGRLGILPPLRWLALSVFVALAMSAVAVRRRSERVRLAALPAVLLIPWLPGVTWPAVLVWTGPLRSWLWAAAVIGVAAPTIVRRSPRSLRGIARDPKRAPWLAAALAAVLYLAAARSVFPVLPNGDEPHYLVITQ